VWVYDPHDREALTPVFEDGARVVGAGARREVAIADCFALACRRIRVEDESDTPTARTFRTDNTLAWYANNLARSLLVWDGMNHPVGPCGVTGEIVLTFEVEAMLRRGEVDAVRYVIAHEVTHVLDACRG
jgi:hypothetical protein